MPGRTCRDKGCKFSSDFLTTKHTDDTKNRQAMSGEWFYSSDHHSFDHFGCSIHQHQPRRVFRGSTSIRIVLESGRHFILPLAPVGAEVFVQEQRENVLRFVGLGVVGRLRVCALIPFG